MTSINMTIINEQATDRDATTIAEKVTDNLETFIDRLSGTHLPAGDLVAALTAAGIKAERTVNATVAITRAVQVELREVEGTLGDEEIIETALRQFHDGYSLSADDEAEEIVDLVEHITITHLPGRYPGFPGHPVPWTEPVSTFVNTLVEEQGLEWGFVLGLLHRCGFHAEEVPMVRVTTTMTREVTLPVPVGLLLDDVLAQIAVDAVPWDDQAEQSEPTIVSDYFRRIQVTGVR